ncbi:hypothetical protein A4H97_07290 [Niastella yeongjuensis]|uniref:Uncharacterized protein n=1 Tax=Niastella yeongjuensis TaxID=354355 RepID=A0A1V9EMD7_9BACT|nr:hypothetical protein [Niastella yeongjuensis]OQP47300.1 hypothetical protein A4H97_07290 [Niastella yeongjuensis]
MCQYINVVLSADLKTEMIKPLFAKHGLGYNPFQNQFIFQQLKKNVQLVNTTTKQCDCGSIIGIESHPAGKGIQPKDIERLRRKGWSETKIKNWIADKTKTDFQAQDREKERIQWMVFLHEAINEYMIGMVGLYIHWYDNSIFDEEIIFKDKKKISLSELQVDTLGKLRYDILYEFIP